MKQRQKSRTPVIGCHPVHIARRQSTWRDLVCDAPSDLPDIGQGNGRSILSYNSSELRSGKCRSNCALKFAEYSIDTYRCR